MPFCAVGSGTIYKVGEPDKTPVSDPHDPPVVLYTKVDVQCDKLVTDDRRQFITLSVHLS